MLVTIDTFRADRLNATVTPNLDRLAARSVRFTSARSAVPLTLPSHTTILTGELPTVHGVRQNGLTPLFDARPTVAQLLKDNGYDTAAFVGAFVLDRRFGLAQGFDFYEDQIPRDQRATERLEAERPAGVVVDRALVWLNVVVGRRTLSGRKPFFAWVHLYDPHAPYTPPREFVRTTSHQPAATDLYDGEVAYTDAQIARVLDWLVSTHLDRETIVIVAGDHGEGLGDHGERTHGMLLYDSTLHVPLVVSKPGAAAATVTQPVSLVDIAPTILGAAGVTPPSTMTGRDLMTASVAQAFRPADIYAETEYPRVAGWAPLQALTDGRWKAIRAGAATELYDLEHDALEQHDVAATQASTAAAFVARIETIRTAAKAPAPTAVSAEAQERLRALGYVASSPSSTNTDTAPNPSAHIATWNAFEEALTALNAHEPRAVAMLALLASSSRDAPVFQTTYARSLLDGGRAADALAAYRAAAKRWPTDATLLHDLAVAARAAGRLDEARDADAAALALAPDSALAHNGAGLIAIDQRRPQDAVREFERATALDATNGEYWSNLGNARRALGYRGGAKQAYERAIAIDPRTADAANGLGVLLVEAQRPAEAVAWFERAVTAAPDMVEAKLNLGIALQQSGNAARAAETYRDVLKAPVKFARERDAAAKLLASLGAAR
jgi:tetratricopeptide (TPR) repeat protein